MTYPIQNSSFRNSPTEGLDGFEEGYDPGMGEGTLESGDQFIPPQDSTPALSAGDLRRAIQQTLADLEQNRELSASDKNQIRRELNALKAQVNSAMAFQGEKREAKLAEIQGGLESALSQMAGEPAPTDEVPEFPEDGENTQPDKAELKALKKELRRAISDIESRSNLTADEKIELKAPLEKHLTEIDIAKKDAGEIDPESIREDIDATRKDTEQRDAYSPGLKGLGEMFGMEPEVLKGKAKAKGIDLNALPQNTAPSLELLQFLTELSPELKGAFKKVEDALNERVKLYETNRQQAAAISAHNSSSTTDSDNTTLTSWQTLFDLKHFQDPKSLDVKNAMQELVQSLIPVFKALYPNEEVKEVTTSGSSGWQKTQAEYLVADQIQIGNMTLDLIHNLDGKMQVGQPGTGADIAIEIPTIAADGEGSGEWTIPQLQTYDEGQGGYEYYGG